MFSLRVPLNEVCVAQNMLSILTAVLDDTKQLEGDSHIKKAFLFSCIWSIGSLFLQKDQLVFEKFLKSLTVELVHII